MRLTEFNKQFSIKTFESSGTTPAINHAALVIAIAKDDNVLSVTGSTPELIITFVKDVVYRAAANNASSAISYHTAMVHSVGEPAEVKAALAEGMAFKGVTNQGGTNIVSPDFGTAVASDKIIVEVDTTVGDRTDRHELVFYVGKGGTAAYTRLNVVFGI